MIAFTESRMLAHWWSPDRIIAVTHPAMAHVRKEFPDSIKAQIFARDRATCAFTGKSVWAFDYGASPLWETDWPDHIRPSSRGGSNEIENGVCASSFANSKKASNTRDASYWFWHGKPTEYYLHAVGSVPESIAAQIRRLSGLKESDWYLNRAAKDVLLAVEQTAWPSGKTRTPDYWCDSAIKRVKTWKSKAAGIESLEDRKVLLMPLDQDQRILLQLRDCNNLSDIREIKRLLVPHRRANWRIYEGLLKALSGNPKVKIPDVLQSAEADKDVSPRFLDWIKSTANTLESVGIERT